MTRGGFIVVLILAAAAAASWLLLARPDDANKARTPSIEAADFGYYLLDARLVGLDSDGHALYTLRADRIEQLPADDSVSLQRVTVDYASGSDLPWTAAADTGHIPASGDVIELEGNVHLARAGATGAARVEIDTTQLELAVREHIARTPAPVSLIQGRSTVSAIGLEADLSNERLRLGSRVRARFGPGAS